MRILTRAALIITASFVSLPAPADEAGTASLTVRLTGLKSAEGTVRVALFESEAGYTGDTITTATFVAADLAGVAVVFPALKPGAYALKSFHDLNGNEKLDANLLGIPTEPFGFSNNAVGNMGPASWADAQFTITAGENTHAITLE